MRSHGLWRDRNGAAALEFSFALPVLLVLAIGILQLGLAFFASAGLRNGVETGARYGGIYPTPSDADVRAKVIGSVYGLDLSKPYSLAITHGTSNGENYTDVAMTYPYRFNFVLFQTSAFQLSYTRRVYSP